MEWIIILLLIIFGFFGTSPQPPSSEPPPGETSGDAQMAEGARVSTVIETVEAQTTRSIPAQINLRVVGYQPDGCEFPIEVVQGRDGNSVTVEIFRTLPADTMCPMNIVPYEATIPLDGDFPQGDYTITVNGVVIQVSI